MPHGQQPQKRPEPEEVNVYKADDPTAEPTTREQWIAYHVARAPKSRNGNGPTRSYFCTTGKRQPRMTTKTRKRNREHTKDAGCSRARRLSLWIIGMNVA